MDKESTSDYTLSTPVKGMNKDAHPMYMDKGSYTHALNAAVESMSGDGTPLIQNEGSNVLEIVAPEGYKFVCALRIQELNRILFFLAGPDSSEIGEVIFTKDGSKRILRDTGSVQVCDEGCSVKIDETAPLEDQTPFPLYEYRTIINDPCLNFSIDFPIDAEYKIMDCSLNIYWVDGNNPDRFLYFDLGSTTDPLSIQQRFFIIDRFEVPTGTFGDCPVPVYSTDLDCNAIKLQPSVERFCLKPISVSGGGGLEEGAYQFMACYADEAGNPMTSYSPATNGVSIYEPAKKQEDQVRKTDKSIKISVSGPDPRVSPYKYYNIVVAKTVNNITTFIVAGTYPIDIQEVTYTGSDPSPITLSAQEVFADFPYYKHSRGVTKSNDYLFRDILTGWEELNLQQAANRVRLNWFTTEVPEGIYSDPIGGEKYRTYPRDEVFPFGIVFEFDNNDETPVYPLSNREPRKEDTDIVGSKDVIEDDPTISCDDSPGRQRWQVYNTAKVISAPHQSYDPCRTTIWEIGEFAYWQSTEMYPNKPEIWGELACKPIRHFKFPDSLVTHIHDGQGGKNSFEDNNKIYPLGIMVDHQSVIDCLVFAVEKGLITQEDRDRIKSYRIVRGNRAGHKSVVARGLLFDVWSYKKKQDPNKYYYANYPFNDLRPDPFISPTKDTYVDDSSVKSAWKNTFEQEGRYTFHSPDTHFSNPTLGGLLKLETLEYGWSDGFFNQVQNHSRQKFISSFGAKFLVDMGIAMGLLAAWPPRYHQLEGNVSFLGIGIGGSTTYYAPSVMPDVYKGMMGYITFHKAAKEAIENLIGFRNFAYQYQAVGKYNNFIPVPNDGYKVRKLLDVGYLSPTVQAIPESSSDTLQSSSIIFNNWNRESSVYLHSDPANGYLPIPGMPDFSRYLASETDHCDTDGSSSRAEISAYYATIKNNTVDQYGSIYNIEWLETGMCSVLLLPQAEDEDLTPIITIENPPVVEEAGPKMVEFWIKRMNSSCGKNDAYLYIKLDKPTTDYVMLEGTYFGRHTKWHGPNPGEIEALHYKYSTGFGMSHYTQEYLEADHSSCVPCFGELAWYGDTFEDTVEKTLTKCHDTGHDCEPCFDHAVMPDLGSYGKDASEVVGITITPPGWTISKGLVIPPGKTQFGLILEYGSDSPNFEITRYGFTKITGDIEVPQEYML